MPQPEPEPEADSPGSKLEVTAYEEVDNTALSIEDSSIVSSIASKGKKMMEEADSTTTFKVRVLTDLN